MSTIVFEVIMCVLWAFVGCWLITLTPWAGIPFLLIIVPLRIVAACINIEEEAHA